MNREQAYTLIRKTFAQGFEKVRFRNYAINLLNHIDESKASAWNSQYVKDAFKNDVSRFERIGTYTSPDNEKLDVLIVHLTTESKLERARTAIRNFVADHLKTRDEKDAALVAFVSPTEKQWRFSYVKMEYATVEKESGKVGVETRLTPARRFSYIVGEGESCHTAQTRFLSLLQNTQTDPKLADIEESFSVEAVTEEFFKRYAELFGDIHKALDKLVDKNPAIRDELKNVSTVDFAKKLMGQIVFLYFLQKKGWLGIAKGQDWGAGPHDFLRRLANGEHGRFDNFFNDILEPLFYDTLATDRGHESWCERFNCRIPFLNGGLFEPPGGYDWRRTDILLPNRLFTNNDPFEEGITGTGVLDVFDRYNFTVNEAEPLEKEVAIDPEMLGKVFENLIEENRRKGLGTFYTPREIVHYMCQESLINYLDTALNIVDEHIVPNKPKQSKLFGKSETEQLVLKNTVRRILVHREDIETFVHLGDQAAHYEAARMSGTKSYKPELPKSIETHARVIDEKLAEITVCDPAVGSGAFPVGMMTEIVRARSTLTPYFNDVHERTPYFFKRHAIQNCLYGVDIDPGAVEIAKLRLWLSLVVDEEDVKQIKPLPNLDYKIVAGNSLVGVEKGLFNNDLFKQLEKLKPQYFGETDTTKKALLKLQIDDLIHQLTNGKEIFDFKIYFSEVFHKKGGFDVVIANPPYMNTNEMKSFTEIYRRLYTTAHGSYDIYVIFFEQAINITKPNGTTCFITSNKYLIADYGIKLRHLMLKNLTVIKLVDLADCKRIFLAALVSPSITIALNTPSTSSAKVSIAVLKDDDVKLLPNVTFRDRKLNELASGNNKIFDIHVFGDTQTLINKLFENSIELEDLSDVRTGVMGFDYWSLAEFINEGTFKNGIRIATNGFIDRYEFTWGQKARLYKKDYYDPYLDVVKCPLNENTKKLFGKNKIIIRGIARKLSANIDEEGIGLLVAVHCAVINNPEKMNPKYILALLNSRLMNWYHLIKFYTARIPEGSLRYPISFLKTIPIKKASLSEQLPIVKLVDQIIAVKKARSLTVTSALEAEIDRIVYQLYGLTEDEIAIVAEKSS